MFIELTTHGGKFVETYNTDDIQRVYPPQYAFEYRRSIIEEDKPDYPVGVCIDFKSEKGVLYFDNAYEDVLKVLGAVRVNKHGSTQEGKAT